METIVQWLSAPGALVTYPFTLNRWNVAALLASSMGAYRVVIITDDFSETLASSTTSTLNSFPLLKYSDFDSINSVLQNSEIEVVIVDDIRMLSTISPAIDFTKVRVKLVILTTWGDTRLQLDTVTEHLPDLGLLALDITRDNGLPQWKMVTVPMSQEQLPYYDAIRHDEISGHLKNKNRPYPVTRMATLYKYPFDQPIEVTKGICTAELPVEPDLVDHPKTWLSVGYLPTLESDGPKLAAVLDAVSSEWPRKQIIVTQFTHRYGVDLITSFLKLAIRDNASPYEESELFPVECSDDYDQYLASFQRFDAAESGVLITNVVPAITLHQVSVLHLVDSYLFTPIITTLHKIHKRNLVATGTQLKIYLYIATHHQKASADQVLSATFIEQVQTADRNFDHLVAAAQKIVFSPTQGLVV